MKEEEGRLKFIVYLGVCRKTNKAYVGATSQLLRSRVSQHSYDSKRLNTKISHAIASYGFDSFDWVILDQSDDHAEILSLEEAYIELYGTLDPGGYNSRPRSLGLNVGTVRSPEFVQRIIDNNTGRKRSAETRRRQSRAKREYHPLKGRKGKLHPVYNKPWTPERRARYNATIANRKAREAELELERQKWEVPING